jgi:hypothetical protein
MEKRIGSARHSAKCPSCGIKLISLKWSESTDTDDIVNLWRCPICGCDFATTFVQTPRNVELIEDRR